MVEQSHLDFGQDINRTPEAKIRIKENTIVEEYKDERAES